MVALFTTAFAFSYPFPAQVFAALNKYPNPLAPHVISMDVLSRTIQDDGSIRSERIIGIQQDSPKWVTRVSVFFLTSTPGRPLGTDDFFFSAAWIARRHLCSRSLLRSPFQPTSPDFSFFIPSRTSQTLDLFNKLDPVLPPSMP